MSAAYLFVNKTRSVFFAAMRSDNCITGSIKITSPCGVYINLVSKSDCC